MVGRVDMDQGVVTDYSSITKTTIPSETTDGVIIGGDARHTNENFSEYWGFFNNVGGLKSALLMKSIWAVGKGWTADDATTKLLENIKGWGKDTFDDILFNMDLIKNVNGDSYAQIMRNDNGKLINLKCLDPASMVTVVSPQGIIKGYEQVSKIKGKAVKKFKVNEIFHLSNNRLADQIHGISDIEGLRDTIIADKENFNDSQKLSHFQAKPFILFRLKTDDPTKIANFVTRLQNARKLGEDLVIPDDDDIVSAEVIQLNPSSFIQEWRNDLKNRFYREVGMPEVAFGTSGATESGGKMEIFAHETVFEHNQRYMEKQVWNQLAKKIDLIPPNSLLDNLQTDEKKDANVQTQAVQPNEVAQPQGQL